MVQRWLEEFIAAHRQGWSRHTLECYNSILWVYQQRFPDNPGTPEQVQTWLRNLLTLWQAKPLKTSTRRDYYERIRFAHRWGRGNVAGGQDIPELPYESFRPKEWRS